MATVNVNPKASIDRALTRLIRIMTREGTLKEVRKRRFFEKKSRRKYKHMRRVKYNQRQRSIDEAY